MSGSIPPFGQSSKRPARLLRGRRGRQPVHAAARHRLPAAGWPRGDGDSWPLRRLYDGNPTAEAVLRTPHGAASRCWTERQQDGVDPGSGGQGRRRHRAAGPVRRAFGRRDRPATHHRPRDRPLDGGDVLDVSARRPDVWPVDDFGVRKGFASIHKQAELAKPKELLALGEIYRPHRSVAAWYCWRAVDTVLPD